MYIPRGIKASTLMGILEKMIKEHGDKMCFAGGDDYPEGVEGVRYQKKGDGYISDDSFVIY